MEVIRLRNVSKILSVFFIIFSLFFLWASTSIRTLKPEIYGNRLGPKFLPQVLLIGIIIFSSIMFYESIKNPEALKKFEKNDENKKGRLIKTIVLSFLFVIMFSYLGGFPAIFIFVILFLLVWNIRSPFALILSPVIVVISIYFLFHYLLSVRFPEGIFKLF